MAWWLVPFVQENKYTSSLYENLTDFKTLFFPHEDAWAWGLAVIGVVIGCVKRSRFAMVFAAAGFLSALAVALCPQGSLYNVRFLPLYFIAMYVVAGWCTAVIVESFVRAVRHRELSSWVKHLHRGDPKAIGMRPWPRPFRPGALLGSLVGLLIVVVVVVPPFIPSLHTTVTSLGVHPSPTEVTTWSAWNYTGYEGKPAYPEYQGLMQMFRTVGKRYGCGRAMWQYSPNENRFGTPEALMLIPYWTTGCVDSMEGLLFESSATTPFHFLNQSELSATPSRAMIELPYGTLNITEGVKHLQLLGVRYFLAETKEVQSLANNDPTLAKIDSSGPWTSPYDGGVIKTTWVLYRVKHSSIVAPLHYVPDVLDHVAPTQTSWLGTSPNVNVTADGPAIEWYDTPSDFRYELVESGEGSWPTLKAKTATHPTVKKLPSVKVSDVDITTTRVSFSVNKTGIPVLVKISYFPNWHANGATGPFRATPNVMVVVPTSHKVTLYYGSTPANKVGDGISVLCFVTLGFGFFLAIRKKRKKNGRREHHLAIREETR
jgi:hypothetical protein